MQVSTKAIVLSKIRYNDHDLIVKCYTRHNGIQSYLLKNILKSKKGKLKPAYFQLFSLLEIEVDHKDNRSLNYIKDVKVSYKTDSIHTNIAKSAIVIFLAEVTSGILKEEEQNLELFDYIETSIQWFEEQDSYSNFHFLYLIELTKYLGFYPELNQESSSFDLLEGKFQDSDQGIYCVSRENLTALKTVLGIKFDSNKKLPMTSAQKRKFLDMILLYFKLHLDGFKEPKSVSVLNQVFS